VRFGFWLAVLAWVWTAGWLAAAYFFPTVPWCFVILLPMAFQVLAAMCSAVLCARFVQFLRLPEEARDALRVEVPETLGWWGLIASWLLLAMDVVAVFLLLA